MPTAARESLVAARPERRPPASADCELVPAVREIIAEHEKAHKSH
jgi:hypothetical protein